MEPVPPVPDVSDWRALYEFADKQKIIGVTDPTKHDVRMGMEMTSQWFGAALQIEYGNTLLNSRTVELSQYIREAGFRCCILKGQGNAEMYPNPLSRTPGDIDVWVDADEETIQEFVKERFPDARKSFKHIKFPIFNDVEVDMHETPLKLLRPRHQRQLQRWMDQKRDEQFFNSILLTGTNSYINVPTAGFNAVYQLGHIMIHLFDEGIGFRQLVDYFFVLKKLDGISCEERDEIIRTWKSLGMFRLARAVMWIEGKQLGLPEKCMLAVPDSRLGTVLLEDVIEGGNFGQYSVRQQYSQGGKRMTRRVSTLVRLLKLSPCFPTEAFYWIINRCINLWKSGKRRQ